MAPTLKPPVDPSPSIGLATMAFRILTDRDEVTAMSAFREYGHGRKFPTSRPDGGPDCVLVSAEGLGGSSLEVGVYSTT